MKNKLWYAGIVTALLTVPFSVHATVVISEIMYDLEGADAGREWIEVFNSGASPVPLAEWRFFENGTNHVLSPEMGSGELASGAYAIIADDPDAFLADNPGFSDTLFNSAFSLSNTGETLILRDAELVDRDEVAYNAEQGGGDGQTLALQSDGLWSASAPTPGSGTLSVSESAEDDDTRGTEDSSEESSDSAEASAASPAGGGANIPVMPQIHADAGKNRTVIVGADSVFEGTAFGTQDAPLEGARYLWNFGDGSVKEGKRVFHHYDFPGRYVVVLTANSGEYSASDSFVATADPVRLALSGDAEKTVIENSAAYRVDISSWNIQDASGARFIFPEETYLLPGSKTAFSTGTTGVDGRTAKLLYPNGVAVSVESFPATGEVVTAAASSASAPEPTAQVSQKAVGMPVVSAASSPPASELEEKTTPAPVPRAGELAAAAGAAGEDGEILWYAALAGFLAIGGAATYIAARKRDEFEIIDEG